MILIHKRPLNTRMAFQIKGGFTEVQDFAEAIIRQRNSCPICHLPLCYGKPTKDAHGTYNTDPDTCWFHIQNVMKFDIDDNSNLFGKCAVQTNVEKCHLVGTIMIPQITSLKLYTTPAKTVDMAPDRGYYLYPEKQRDSATHRFMRWDFGVLCRDKTKFRMHEYLNTAGVHYFLACVDCNAAHTGHHQLQHMTKKIFGKKTNTARVFSMYTIMFDNMADNFPRDGPPTITVTDERKKFWQTELWLNYCTIMFLAQQTKIDISSQGDRLGQDLYRFTFAHRDMGMCDFYMNQILSTILYMNFDIEIDFIWLHQNFLSFLPQWAKSANLFTAPKYDYNCTWRLVLGAPVGTGELCVRTDISSEYWIENLNHREIAVLLMERIHEFTTTWLIPIGRAITTPNGTPLSVNLRSVRELYDMRIDAHKQALLSAMRFTPVRGDGITLDNAVMRNPDIGIFHEAFRTAFPVDHGKQLFKNFVSCALSRTTQAFRNADPRGKDYHTMFRKMELVSQYAQLMTA